MKNKIKITYIIPSLDMGGAERLLTEISMNINREIFDISVICLRRTGIWAKTLKKIGVDVQLVGSLPKLEFLSIPKIRKMLKKNKPDIVHTHLFGADVYGGIAALSLGIENIISTEHNLNYNEGSIKKKLKTLVVNRFSRIIAVSDSVRDYAISNYNLERNKVSVFHNGIHFEKYFEKVNVKEKKQMVIGSAGRLNTQKGFASLIKAMRFVDKNISLQIAGDGKLKYDLRYLIKKYKLKNRVSLVGPQKNIQKFYKGLDIYVQPSKWEGLGISVLEAGAAGLPVIASRVDGIREIIEDGLDGFLYNYGDEKLLAEKINNLAGSREKREEFATALQKNIFENFSIFSMIEKYENIYQSEVAKKKKVLLINKYHYLKGGAERAYFDTAKILIERGYEVAYFSMKHPRNEKTKWSKYFIENIEYNDNNISVFKKIKAIFAIWYNFQANRRLRKLIKEFKPDIAHLHNIYHQISPSIINVLKKNKIPSVYTLHDYKLISPNYSLMLHGNIWEGTKKKKYYKCFFAKCIKDSYLKSLVSVVEAYLHQFLGLYKKVNEYISPSNFLIEKFDEFGFENEINYLPNPLPFTLGEASATEDYFLYYGRLSREKGIFDLISAYLKSKTKNKLYIVGDGPEKEKIEKFISEKNLADRILLLAYMSGRELEEVIEKALAVVVPSRWYENAPYTVIEAMSAGKIVIATKLGGLAEMIRDGENGYLFNFADRNDLALKLNFVSDLDARERKEIGARAMRYVKNKNSKDAYYKNLTAIYNRAITKVNLEKKKRYYIFRLFIFALAILIPLNTIAIFGFAKKNTFPKLANYYLHWEISDQEAKELARWDLLVLDMETQINSRNQLKKIRQYNPDIIILAYVTAGEIRQDACSYNMSMLRCELFNKIKDDWYLRDENKNKTIAWPGTNMLNFGTDKYNTNDSWNDTLAKFAYYRLMTSGVWDGVFYDTMWHNLYWVNNGKLDVNNDGRNDNIAYVNERYKNGVVQMLATTRSLFGDNFIILENGSSHVAYQPQLNGVMYESFPTPWEGAGYWPNVMKSYLEKARLNVDPKIQIINANSKNKNNYKEMRWGLGNALLGNAYYSFDFGESDHGQTWWYKEYDLDLGRSVSSAYRVDGSFSNYEKGLWRRNFEKGVVFVNSEEYQISYKLDKKYINPRLGNILVDKIELEGEDSIILLNNPKRENTVVNTVSVTKESTQKIISKVKEKIVKNEVSKNKEIIYELVDNNTFDKIKGKTNIVDSNNDALYEKVLGALWGEESLVKIIDNKTKKLLGLFFAYPKVFHCGVNIAIGDFDGDKRTDIAVVPAWGGAHLKIFGFDAKLKKELFFHDKSFRGFYSIKSVYDKSISRDMIFITIH